MLTQFENFKNMSIETLVEWLDKHGQFDGSPWMKWWDENYCKRCEPIKCHYADCEKKLNIKPFYDVPIMCSWCALKELEYRYDGTWAEYQL